MSELKPCPFCGGEAEIERLGDRRQSTIYSCTNCGCRLETCEEWGHGNRWNTRTPDATLLASHKRQVERLSAPVTAEDTTATGMLGDVVPASYSAVCTAVIAARLGEVLK